MWWGEFSSFSKQNLIQNQIINKTKKMELCLLFYAAQYQLSHELVPVQRFETTSVNGRKATLCHRKNVPYLCCR